MFEHTAAEIERLTTQLEKANTYIDELKALRAELVAKINTLEEQLTDLVLKNRRIEDEIKQLHNTSNPDIIDDVMSVLSLYGSTANKLFFFDPLRKGLFLKYKIAHIHEEISEIDHAYESKDYQALVDGLIDVVYIAIGTLLTFSVDVAKAWRTVQVANMQKRPCPPGFSGQRFNPLGLPDLMKPDGWKPPDHNDNVGTLPQCILPDATT